MPLEDFLPGNVNSVNPTGRYLITGTTLKKLLQRVECDPSQFDVKETPEKRIYSYKKADQKGGSASDSTGENNFDIAFYQCSGNAIDPPSLSFTLTVRDGLSTITGTDPGPESPYPRYIRFDQMSCITPDGP